MNAKRLFAGLLALAAAQCAWAGVFSVTPVRIYMTPKDRAIAVTITNEADEPVALQADIYEWRQAADGADELVPSEDLILAPPITKLAAKAKQVVRLARLMPPDASRQLTYRLILRELPEANLSKGITVPVALALSMPVFITPPAAKPRVACDARREEGGAVFVYCANTGNAYTQVREVIANQNAQTVARFQGGAYVLPGARRRIALSAEKPIATGPLQLLVMYDDGSSQTFDLPPL
jgi:fimbrial chaperone protein